MSDMADLFTEKKKPHVLDLCVPLVYAKTDIMKVYREIQVKLPSYYYDVKCEDLQITKRSIGLESDNVVICLEYNVAYKFYPVNGERVCQTYKSKFTKTIPLHHFRHSQRKSVSIKDFISADGACIFVRDMDVKNGGLRSKLVDNVYHTIVTSIIKVAFEIKLFSNHNVYVLGMSDKLADPMPVNFNPCHLGSKK